MNLRDNRDSIISNIVQQGAATFIFLFIPSLLSVESYGQVTVVSTLMSLSTFADLGFTFVYSRRMPAIYHKDSAIEIARWDSTILRVKIYGSMLFAMAISLFYGIKYGDSINALLLLLALPLGTLISFFTTQRIVKSGFSQARDVNILQSLYRLILIPCVVLLGLRGWFVGQVLALIAMFVQKRLRSTTIFNWNNSRSFDANLLRDNFKEALSLGLISTIWMQMLSSGRLFAAFSYSDAVVAQYGIASTVYQMIASVIIAAFVPQTVKVNRMLELDRTSAINYVFQVISYALPIVMLVTAICFFAVPPLLHVIFPAYSIEPGLLLPFLLSLISFPVIVSLGVILSGTGHNSAYLSLLAGAIGFDWLLLKLLSPYYGVHAAAISQLLGLSLYAVALVLLVMVYFSTQIRKKRLAWISIAASLVAPGLYLGCIP